MPGGGCVFSLLLRQPSGSASCWAGSNSVHGGLYIGGREVRVACSVGSQEVFDGLCVVCVRVCVCVCPSCRSPPAKFRHKIPRMTPRSKPELSTEALKSLALSISEPHFGCSAQDDAPRLSNRMGQLSPIMDNCRMCAARIRYIVHATQHIVRRVARSACGMLSFSDIR